MRDHTSGGAILLRPGTSRAPPHLYTMCTEDTGVGKTRGWPMHTGRRGHPSGQEPHAENGGGGGGGAAIGQVWTRHCRSGRACPTAFIALSVHHMWWGWGGGGGAASIKHRTQGAACFFVPNAPLLRHLRGACHTKRQSPWTPAVPTADRAFPEQPPQPRQKPLLPHAKASESPQSSGRAPVHRHRRRAGETSSATRTARRPPTPRPPARGGGRRGTPAGHRRGPGTPCAKEPRCDTEQIGRKCVGTPLPSQTTGPPTAAAKTRPHTARERRGGGMRDDRLRSAGLVVCRLRLVGIPARATHVHAYAHALAPVHVHVHVHVRVQRMWMQVYAVKCSFCAYRCSHASRALCSTCIWVCHVCVRHCRRIAVLLFQDVSCVRIPFLPDPCLLLLVSRVSVGYSTTCPSQSRVSSCGHGNQLSLRSQGDTTVLWIPCEWTTGTPQLLSFRRGGGVQGCEPISWFSEAGLNGCCESDSCSPAQP